MLLQPNFHQAMASVLGGFEESTGLTVKLESIPATSGVDNLTHLSTSFASGTSPYDVVSDSDESSPLLMRAGWLMPLDDIIPAETWADFPDSMSEMIDIWHKYEGTYYRIPHVLSMGYFWTRKDLLDERGMAAPATWEELVELGKEFADPPNNMWGTTDGLLKPALLFVYLAYLTAQAGGDIFAFDDGTAAAFQFLHDMIHTHQIFPEAALSNDYSAQNEYYFQDRVPVMRQWAFIYDVARSRTDWYAPEKMTVELPPGGPAGRKSWIGGWGYEIPAFAPNPDGAAELIRYLTSVEVAPQLAQASAQFVSPRQSIVEAFKGTNYILEQMVRYGEEGVYVPRPFHPKVAQAQAAVEDVASLYLFNQATLQEALSQGRKLIAALDE